MGDSAVVVPDGSRMSSENELAMARFQGHHVATGCDIHTLVSIIAERV
jgi:hypothetical protein